MRNFGNDSFASQHHYLHHQLAPPPPHQHHLAMVPTAVAMPTTTHQPGKIDPYPLTKTVGVGTATATNLNKHNKSHFSPVSVIAPSSHHQNHLSGSTGHHNSNNNASANSTTTNNNGSGIPINHSHPHHHHAAVVATSAAGVSHLPTATLAAACPTPANGGPSPAHLQQIPVNGLPYHPSHSPTLPVPSKLRENPFFTSFHYHYFFQVVAYLFPWDNFFLVLGTFFCSREFFMSHSFTMGKGQKNLLSPAFISRIINLSSRMFFFSSNSEKKILLCACLFFCSTWKKIPWKNTTMQSSYISI